MAVVTQAKCYHCGDNCGHFPIRIQDHSFCCEGCKTVYELLQAHDMGDYYTLANAPGMSQKEEVRKDKFAFLDQASIAQALLQYHDDQETHIVLYLPQIHCSSCLWLLENLHQLHAGIASSRVNFARKEASIIFHHQQISLREVAELLSHIGYEPAISLQQLQGQSKPVIDHTKRYKLGVAGFCFANIMLFSFPEYLGIDSNDEQLRHLFWWMNVALSIPVVFYSASEFYVTAWKNLRHGFLHIDLPIVAAIIVTFARSLYEVFTQTGGGYFDSMSGIVFLMLVGRVLQDKTYQQFNFERDYTAYFPVAVTRLSEGQERAVALPDIHVNDTLRIHHGELIPADGIIMSGNSQIDYSFVTGESMPVLKEAGEIVYAGGKSMGGVVELLVIKPVAQSYLTSLWNKAEMKETPPVQKSFVHLLSKYFTAGVFAIATAAALYWQLHNAAKAWNVFTAVLIVACPCALLLSNTFTNGNILRLLGHHGFYLRNAQVIENLAKSDFIVFDKTGTLTDTRQQQVHFEGDELTYQQKLQLATLAAQSGHPLSRAIVAHLNMPARSTITGFLEIPGEGMLMGRGEEQVAMGARKFIVGDATPSDPNTSVYASIGGHLLGCFRIHNQYRIRIDQCLLQLKKNFRLAVISGDNNGEAYPLQQLLGTGTDIRFRQTPASKLRFIQSLQAKGHQVIMVGDGLNDAGALKQAHTGISVSDHHNNFTPASDAIIAAASLPLLPQLLRLCRANRYIILFAFFISILYNLAGIYFAVTARLSPMIAAILMPCSSISIVAITAGFSNGLARLTLLNKPTDESHTAA
ncbi:Cu+-exporting ATPase [Chitinophaga costaii]|uniref:Cu+-exporting ATPase n=1 Tax=Chitinophaga costaii TaxID=1335309 RepID=A0A1C4CUG4_9BACT|nr:heavy metal translocating P-type ATPase metal-binding domain-containing protein [Chitinophaga costaii]PUZ26939.1 heavy metal translocating P-type ATPase [Chitinophaga costaii]SCC22804.1 Cu+-exporting ATPase [Chitinophaga costaii]